jgi:hypothetical protein
LPEGEEIANQRTMSGSIRRRSEDSGAEINVGRISCISPRLRGRGGRLPAGPPYDQKGTSPAPPPCSAFRHTARNGFTSFGGKSAKAPSRTRFLLRRLSALIDVRQGYTGMSKKPIC